MFFYIGKHCDFLTKVNDNLFLDKGWHVKNNIYFKGYSCECSIEESIDDIINGYQPNGIWAVICNNKIYHSILRGFPLYQKDEDLTNIPNLNNFQLVYNNINWLTDNSELPVDIVVDKVLDILQDNINGFVKYNNETLKVLLTGGLDSTVIFALMHTYSNVKLVKSPNKVRTYNSKLINYLNKNHWAYNIIDIYHDKVFNLTGFAAEVMTMRGYDVFNLLCQKNNKNIFDIISENDYVYHFLNRRNLKKRLSEKVEILSDWRLAMLKTLDVDYYIWHLDHNFHFVPFYDKRIPEVCVKLNYNDLIENCKNGIIEREIIKKINPKFLTLVSQYKNHGNVFENFDKNFKTLSLC